MIVIIDTSDGYPIEKSEQMNHDLMENGLQAKPSSKKVLGKSFWNKKFEKRKIEKALRGLRAPDKENARRYTVYAISSANKKYIIYTQTANI